MTTFIEKRSLSDNQTNIEKYRGAANITEYYIISKLIFLRISIPKFVMIRQFHIKNLIWTYELFVYHFRVATLLSMF